ncbi:hypothetical protein Clacol_003664 [Clathrus columnatus]|uniref:Uncharacterized protein n=1 Tax=Clathrus columnatus TaxID=1419009 RepID=A0AAV5A704_9AGAM|nr:hypothetical protein Clacol_003664 [Clathrus columnatus]
MENNAQTQAAIKMQRLWRARRARYLDTDARWQDAMERVKLQIGADSANKENNASRSRWRRATMVATHIQDGHGIRNAKRQIPVKSTQSKTLETQHWLELVDEKHRYGSNLKGYHRKWLKEDTTDNFFHWLDYGEGKHFSLRECPRERLESERILYLSEEQRLNYLVKIDGEGKLRWARNDQLVDTARGKWKDLGDGMGIGPASLGPSGQMPKEPSSPISSSALAQHYVTHKKRSRMGRLISNNFTVTGIMNKLLRKTVRSSILLRVKLTL